MPARTYTLQTQAEIKKLFCNGWSLGQLAKKFGISKNTLATWSAKGKWSLERATDKQPLEVLRNGQVVSEDPELDAVRKIVHDCRLAALRREAQIARALAEKSLKAAEALEINDLEGVTTAQRYCQGIWPSDTPGGLQITFDGKTTATIQSEERPTLHLYFAHERDRIEGEQQEKRVLPAEDPPAAEDDTAPPSASDK